MHKVRSSDCFAFCIKSVHRTASRFAGSRPASPDIITKRCSILAKWAYAQGASYSQGTACAQGAAYAQGTAYAQGMAYAQGTAYTQGTACAQDAAYAQGAACERSTDGPRSVSYGTVSGTSFCKSLNAVPVTDHSPFNTIAGLTLVALRIGIRQAMAVTATDAMIVMGISKGLRVI